MRSRKRRQTVEIRATRRKARRKGWEHERTKASKHHAQGYAYQVVFDYRKRAFFDTSSITAVLTSGNYKLKVETTFRCQKVTVLVKSLADLVILRMAEVGHVFRVYKLTPTIG